MTRRICVNCRHFRNSPAYIEEVYKGLSTLSSGYASVRRDDGICERHETYHSATSSCAEFEAREGGKQS